MVGFWTGAGTAGYNLVMYFTEGHYWYSLLAACFCAGCMVGSLIIRYGR